MSAEEVSDISRSDMEPIWVVFPVFEYVSLDESSDLRE